MSQSDYLQPMYFEAVEDGLTISLPSYDIEYRIGIDGEWQTLSAGEFTPSINSGTKIFFKKESKGQLGSFSTNVGFRLGGDCRSLLYGEKATKDSPLYEDCFYRLFYNSLLVEVEDNILPSTQLAKDCYSGMFSYCKKLVNAPKLPATTLVAYCYESMFIGCTSLTKTPELPATTLANSCYRSMFNGCTSLVNAPELPATTLANSCYAYMFYGCTNLSYIKMLATDISAYDCLYYWVLGVASTGTFVKSKDATWDVVGDSGVPTGWTVITDEEESGGGDNIFPMYLTTEQGSGNDRTRDADEKSLAILEYFNNNGITDSAGTKYLTLDESRIFYIDEFLITHMYSQANSIALAWDDMGFLVGYIREDGRIELFYDD